MARRYPMPNGPIVTTNGLPNVPGRAYLEYIQKVSEAMNDVADLDGGTSYTAAELRDKIIEIMTALKG